MLGPAFFGRLQSFDLTGWIRSSAPTMPITWATCWMDGTKSGNRRLMGIGVGTSYPTWRIRNWKSESVMVHNAPLHVWLKYGIAGLICYLWFHVLLVCLAVQTLEARVTRTGRLLACRIRVPAGAIRDDTRLRPLALFGTPTDHVDLLHSGGSLHGCPSSSASFKVRCKTATLA